VSDTTRPPAGDQGVRALRRSTTTRPWPPTSTAPPRHERQRVSGIAGTAVPQALDLRYGENPHSTRRVLRCDRQPGSVGRLGVAAAGQGTVVQQPRRCRHRLRVRAAVRRAGLRDREARRNPCGVAVAASLREAYDRAFRTDPTSAFAASSRSTAARRRDRAHHRRASVVEVSSHPTSSPSPRGVAC